MQDQLASHVTIDTHVLLTFVTIDYYMFSSMLVWFFIFFQQFQMQCSVIPRVLAAMCTVSIKHRMLYAIFLSHCRRSIDTEEDNSEHHPRLHHWASGICSKSCRRLPNNGSWQPSCKVCWQYIHRYSCFQLAIPHCWTKAWAKKNNLAPNKSRSKEIILYDSRRRKNLTPPHLLPDITCENSLKLLGVTLTCNLSACDHIREVISDCTDTVHAPSTT